MSFDLFLPAEILSRIFASLHIEDRKKVRLVCKKWNDCCNCHAILRREKFVFRDGYPLENIDLFLRNCEKIRNTVEFQGLSLDKLSEDIWRVVGDNIYSLKLFQCDGTAEVTKNIFLHCSNMHSFKSSHEYQTYRCGLDDTPYSPAMWNELIQLNIERRKMMNFQLFISGLELPKDVLEKIFKIFPSICNFGSGYPSYLSYIFNSVHIGSLQDTFNPALIKELTFNVQCSGLWIQEFSKLPELKLQKLETILKNPTVSLDMFSQFLQNQHELKTLNITLSSSEKDYSKMILDKILSMCTELVDFRFKCDATLKIDEFYHVLRAVSESKLECFMIWFTPCYDVDDLVGFEDKLSTDLTPLTNERLHTLKLDTGTVGLPEKYCLPILQHFYNLHHLEIAAVSDGILQTIFEYHIHLRTLVLRKIDHCTAVGFTGDESDSSVVKKTYSISRLQELKHLELEGFLDGCWIEKTIRHFNFPHLKYLRLSLWGLEEEINLQYLPARIPSVEILILDEVPLQGGQYSFFCQHLQRLKLLLYTWMGNEGVIRDMFIARSSLKYAVDSVDNAYFYNRFSEVLSIVNFRDLEFKKSVFCDFIRM